MRKLSGRQKRIAEELGQEREAFISFVQRGDWGDMGSFLFDELLRTRQIRFGMQRTLRQVATALAIAGLVLAALAVYDVRQQGVDQNLASENHSLILRVGRDERATKVEGEHTAEVQKRGGPVAVCLLHGIEAVLPVLTRLPGAAAPLHAYVELQRSRYIGDACPIISRPR